MKCRGGMVECSHDKLEELTGMISEALQEFEDLVGDSGLDDSPVRFKFPRRVIKRADYYRNMFTFIDDPIVASNMAYSLMLTDVYRWLLTRSQILIWLRRLF